MKSIKESLLCEAKYTPEEQQEIIDATINQIVKMLETGMQNIKSQSKDKDFWLITLFKQSNSGYLETIDYDIDKKYRNKAINLYVDYINDVIEKVKNNGVDSFNEKLLKKDTGTKWYGDVFNDSFNKELIKMGVNLGKKFRDEFCGDVDTENSEKVYINTNGNDDRLYQRYIPVGLAGTFREMRGNITDLNRSQISSGTIELIVGISDNIIEYFYIEHIPSANIRRNKIVDLSSGLKDAFGREISAGDTVIFNNNGWHASRVEGSTGKFVVLTQYAPYGYNNDFLKLKPSSLIVVRHGGKDVGFEEFVDA